MKNFSSFSQLGQLLTEEEQKSLQDKTAVAKKTGYSGKPVRLKVTLDSRRRNGKTVTLITGFESNPSELQSITQTLKKSCGAGGALVDNSIEIQGDHREKVTARLRDMGFTVA